MDTKLEFCLVRGKKTLCSRKQVDITQKFKGHVLGLRGWKRSLIPRAQNQGVVVGEVNAFY